MTHHDDLVRKLDSLRPSNPTEPAIAPVRIEPDEVTGVLHLALERAAVASAVSPIAAAARRLLRESSAAQAIARSMSVPPGPLELASAAEQSDPSEDEQS